MLAERDVRILPVEWNALSAASYRQPDTISPKSIALLQYTSGSTNAPRGVMVSHGNLMHNLLAIKRFTNRTAEDIGVSWLPHFHDMGLIDGLLSPLFSGYPTVIMSPEAFVQQPFRWLGAISRYRATTSGGPNFAYEHCLRRITADNRAKLDLSSWRVAYNGAEPIASTTLDQFSELFSPCGFQPSSLFSCYGLAENTLIASGQPKPGTLHVDAQAMSNGRVKQGSKDAKQMAIVSCGRPPIEDIAIAIADPETGERCQSGVVGEIWIKGPSVAQGYWNKEAESDAIFRRRLSDDDGPYLRTGDLGFLENDQLYVTGRLKDLIIIRGQNFYPQDIEATVSQAHPAWAGGRAAAFSIENAQEEGLAVVQELPSRFRGQCTDDMVEAIRRSVVERHQVSVAAVALVKYGSIPCTSSGKLQRGLCRKKFLENELSPLLAWIDSGHGSDALMEFSPPQELVAALAQCSPELGSILRSFMVSRAAALLGVTNSELDTGKPLSVHGLDSVKAMALAKEISHATGQELSPRAIYDYPTIDHLCAHLVGRLISQPPADDLSNNARDNSSVLIDDLLADVESLSDEEVAQMLAKQA